MPVPATVELSPLFDPTLDRVGFPLDHPYIEQVYCSVLGPTSVLLLRRFGELLDKHPHGVSVDLVDLGRSLGVGPKSADGEIGRNTPIRRSMDRLVQFHLASWLGDDRLGVHTKVPAVSRHRTERLCGPVQSAHQRLLDDHLGGLVATAEGRGLVAPNRTPAAAGPGVAGGPPRTGSEVVARLRAFGGGPQDLRAVAR